MRKKAAPLFALAAVLCVLIAVYAALGTRDGAADSDAEASADASADAGSSLYLVDAADITGLNWVIGDETCTIEKSGDNWTCPEGYPLDESMIETLIDTASAVTAARTVEGGEDLGLDAPSMVLTVTTASGDTVFTLGQRNSFVDENYATVSGSDTVYLLDTDLYSAFDLSILDLVQMNGFPDDVTVTGLTIDTGTQTLDLTQPDDAASLSYSDDAEWFCGDTVLDTDAVSELIAALKKLSWDGCAAYEPNTLTQFGLDEPAATVTVAYTDSDGNAGTAVLKIGNAADSTEYYAELNDSNVVAYLPSATAETFTGASLETLQSDKICSIDWDTLTGLSISSDGQTTDIAITHGEDADTAACNGATVDADAVQSLLTDITGIESEGSAETDAASSSSGSAVTIVFTRDRETFSEMTMTLTPYNLNFYRVDFNGRDDQLVSIRDVQTILSDLTALTAG